MKWHHLLQAKQENVPLRGIGILVQIGVLAQIVRIADMSNIPDPGLPEGERSREQQVTPETHALNTDPNTQWQPMQDGHSWELDPIQDLCTMGAYDDDPGTDLCSNLLWPLSSRGAVMHTHTDEAVDLNHVDSFADFNCAGIASGSESLQDFQVSSSDVPPEPLVANSSAPESARSSQSRM